MKPSSTFSFFFFLLLSLLQVDGVQDSFNKVKIKVGRRTCLCSFTLDSEESARQSTGSCDKKCFGSVSGFQLAGETHSYTLDFLVKKGRVTVKDVTAVPHTNTTTMPTSPTSEPGGCQLLVGQQPPGTPFTAFTHQANPQACANLCARTSNQCNYWTMNTVIKACFLFASTPEHLSSSPSFTSGNKDCGCILQLNTINNAPGISPGVDRIGPLRDFQDCADLCEQNSECSYWSMNSASGICSLKRSQSQLTGENGFVSGNKACGIDSKTTA